MQTLSMCSRITFEHWDLRILGKEEQTLQQRTRGGSNYIYAHNSNYGDVEREKESKTHMKSQEMREGKQN